MLKNLLKRNIGLLIWYALGVGMPMILGLVKSTLFTKIFTATEYGYYSLVTITFTYFSILSITWISGIIWRYYQSFKNNNRLDELYSNTIFLLGHSVFLLIVFSVFFSAFQNNFEVKKLIFYSLFYFIGKEFVGILSVFLQIEKKYKTYNIIRLIQALFSFLIILVLVFNFDFRIESFLIASSVVDLFIIVYLLNSNSYSFKKKLISKSVIRDFLSFSGKNIIINFLLLAIVSSDRYFILLYDTVENVGIYNQLYNFSELSIGAVMLVLYGVINPNLTYNFENQPYQSKKIIIRYTLLISVVTLPVILVLSLFAKDIAYLIFHKSFAEHFYLIPYILLSAYLYGLVNMVELKMKFQNKMFLIILFYAICLIVNVLLNITFMPEYGFKFAAFSTLFTYSLMFIVFYTVGLKTEYVGEK